MLIISRRVNEAFTTVQPDGTTIKVRVLRMKGGNVRVGIEAPKSVRIVRDELLPAELLLSEEDSYDPGGLICAEDGA